MVREQNILVYTGPGSSNSWIWLADFLEKHGFLNARFCPNPNEMMSPIRGSIAVIPGGDTFRIAESFGEEGLQELKRSIEGGSGYIGICAGAYLPLRSSIAPLSSFNLLDATIANISSNLPKGNRDLEKYFVRYGCSYVFHPARGPLRLTGDRELIAPIYGGPILMPSDGVETRLSFAGLADDTEMIVERNLCERTLKGRAALIEGRYGKGRVLSIAPHLEHPDYPPANDYLTHLLKGFESSKEFERKEPGDTTDIKEFRRVIADLRVLSNALDTRSWKVGIKYWEGEKLLFFIDAVRKRMQKLAEAKKEPLEIPSDALNAFQESLSLLKESKERDIDENTIDRVVINLSKGTSLFLNSYFSRKEK